MSQSSRQNVLIDLHTARQAVVELLKSLEQAQRACEEQLQADNRQDFMRSVRGTSALESAIAEARRMIDTLDRSAEEARQRSSAAGETGSSGVASPAA